MSRLSKLLEILPRPMRSFRPLGLWQERRFWRKWLRSGGGHSPELFRHELDPHTPLAGHVRELVDQIAEPVVRILDVGAGPMTGLGKTHPSKTLAITATDVLAATYERFLRDNDLEPPVPTVYADAERLRDRFAESTFHIVHANNCLDHTGDPLAAVHEMIAVTRARGWVYLRHRFDEAEREAYVGLHQWNLNQRDGQFVIWKPGTTVDVTAAVEPIATVRCETDDEHVIVFVHKLPQS